MSSGALLDFWARHRARLLGLATLLLGGIAVIWLGYEAWRLTLQYTPAGNVALAGPVGAVDLSLRHLEVQGWFSGEQIYTTQGNAVYPPASYLLLWPLVGWLSFPASRWLFAVVVAVALAFLVRVLVRSAGAAPPAERRLLGLAILSAYPVGATIGNGQSGILVMLVLVLSLGILSSRPVSWGRDVAVAALFLCSLVKPTLVAPFFWVVLFARGGLRPAVLIGFCYAGLTGLASLTQIAGPVRLMRSWFQRGVHGAGWGAEFGEGSIRLVESAGGEEHLRITSINLHSALGYSGFGSHITMASFLVLGVLGLWVLWRRRAPLWLVMGVVALVTRFYAYHGWYDDVLLLLPLVALFRVAKGHEGLARKWQVRAGWLLPVMVVSLLAPGGGYLLPYPWNNVYLVLQSGFWLGLLAFLIHLAGLSGAACAGREEARDA